MQENINGQGGDGLTFNITLVKRALEKGGCAWWEAVLSVTQEAEVVKPRCQPWTLNKEGRPQA